MTPRRLSLLPMLLALVLHVFLLCCTEVSAKDDSTRSDNRKALLLDIDNTVYNEKHAQIEAQIIANTHQYCQNVLGISKQHADDLFREYGSTIEGLRQTAWKDLSHDELERKMNNFYHQIYDDIDPSRLLDSSASSNSAQQSSTGYHHAQDERLTRLLLKHSPMDILLASNSPSWHIQKVLRAMGLAKLPSKQQYTPDQLKSFPTKHHPQDFFAHDEQDPRRIPLVDDGYESIAFLDDSLHNLKRVQEAFPESVTNLHHVHNKNGQTLSKSLLQEYGLLDPLYEFSQIKYLNAKNKVDRQSIHVDTWNKVMDELNEDIQSTDDNIWIVDLGAGLLFILDLMLHGDEERGLLPLSIPPNNKDTSIQYTAFESNEELYKACHDRLEAWGFELIENVSSVKAVYEHRERKGFQVRLITESFSKRGSSDACPEQAPNLIVGCCFADLIDPSVLVADLIQSFSLLHRRSRSSTGMLIYFPITFAGVTQFLPACPFERQHDEVIPSDTTAFRWYSHALTSVLGHNLDPHALIASMEDHGAEYLCTGSSDWKIDSERDSYLYKTMLYFFGSTAGPTLLEQGYDAPGWMKRACENRPSIQVTNQDLLFRMKLTFVDSTATQSDDAMKESPKEILFTAPDKVTAREIELPSKLGPRQVLS
ncbi:MAG: hypothetical protein SGILL_002100, partial [Bacillariaceae sp.]